jgi:hypothetical protein
VDCGQKRIINKLLGPTEQPQNLYIMNKTIKSIALLKVIYERDKDYMDLFIPFIATLILTMDYRIIEVERICLDFEREFGLIIPYHPMMTLLKRAKKRGLIKIENGAYIPDHKNLEHFDISTKTFEKTKEIDSLIQRFIGFSKETFNKILTFEDAENILISYIKENDRDIILASQDISLLPNVDSSKEKKYLIYKFIKNVYDYNYPDYKLITHIISGYTLANCIFFDEPNNYKGKIKGIKIFLDTRILLRLVGLEGHFREISYSEFLQFLKDKGVAFSVFEHTIDEINGIIEDCVNWINNPRYKPSLASPVLRHFVENNYDKESVRLFISKIESFISFNDITTESTPDLNESIEFQINETRLFEIIKEVYSSSNNYYEDPSKDDVIFKDVKSISAIYKLRKGKRPNYLKGSTAIFITTNASLAKANNLYNLESCSNHYCIKECMTDVFLGTVIWSDNPVKFNEFNEKKIIANCVASLMPDEILLRKYTKELERLEKDKHLSPNELYFMKTHKIVNEYLVQMTFNDDENFYDKLPEEILKEIKSGIEKESQKKVEEEKHEHQKTQGALDNTRKNLDLSFQEMESIKSQNIQYDIKISKFSAKVAKWTVRILFGILLPIILVAFSIVSFPNVIHNKKVLYIAIIIVFIISTLSGIYGFSIKGFFKKLEFYIKDKIRSIILK